MSNAKCKHLLIPYLFYTTLISLSDQYHETAVTVWLRLMLQKVNGFLTCVTPQPMLALSMVLPQHLKFPEEYKAKCPLNARKQINTLI